jgi:serine/threonine protein kinase/tetratricopeptide (TPR) repeat protein
VPPSESTKDLLADWDLQAPSCGSIQAGADPIDVAGQWAVLGDTAPYPPLRALDRLPGESLGFLDEFSLGEPESEDSPSPWGSGARPDGDTIRRQVRPIGPLSIPSFSGRPDLGQGREGSRPRSSRNLPGEGDVIAGFRILQQLGRGAFAHVYLAEEIRLGGRLVAIKVSRAEGDEPRILARLQHTNIVPVHSVCDDPETGLRVLCMPFFGGANLAQVLDTTGGLTTTGRTGRSLVEALDRISQRHPPIASEFLRPSSARLRSSDPLVDASPAIGPPEDLSAPSSLSMMNGSALVLGFRSLLSRIVRGGPLYPDRPIGSLPDDDPHRPGLHFLRTATAVQAAAWIVARLAEGLDHAHSRGLLHRDLKPANVLLAADGTPMLLDFNLAAESRPQSPEGEIGRAFLGGTLPYMAPEHLDAFSPQGTTAPHDVDHRADLYALGLILFELLTGEHPFPTPTPPPGMSPSDLIRQMIEARRHPPSLRARCPEVPWSFDALVAKCLEFDPGRRYARSRDLAEDLRRFLDDLPMKYAPEPSLRERVAKFSRRHRALCSSTSIALIGLTLILVMGAAAVAVYGGMQGLVARFQRQAFERDFVEAQFLLNTADASDRHLRAGLAKAVELLDRLPLADGRAAPDSAWFRSLTGGEQRRMRQELVELTILEARARVQLASRRGSDSDRLEAIKRAIARLDRVEPVADHAPAALFDERSRYHAALGNTALANRDRRLAALFRPSSCHDWTLLGTTLLSSGDPAAAEQALRQALRLDCTSYWAWFMMGHCHFAQGRFVEAAGDFGACTAHGSQFAWAHFNRGLALARAGLLDSARDAYDYAIRIDPAFAEALVNRALVELELNRVESALADLSLAIKLGRDDVGVLAARGEALSRLGLPAEAERQFQQRLSAEPHNAVVRVARGMTRLRTDPPGAREDFEHVLRNDPRHATANYGMALVVRPEDPKGALKHLNLALDSDPNLVDAIQLRALVRARLGDPATLDDVDRLLKIPTARRYYNAACAVAVYAVQTREPRQFPHAMELLTRAVDLGFPAEEAVGDPDLAPLRERPEFHRLPMHRKPDHDGRG